MTDLKVVFKFFLVQLVCGFHLLKLLLQNLNTIKENKTHPHMSSLTLFNKTVFLLNYLTKVSLTNPGFKFTIILLSLCIYKAHTAIPFLAVCRMFVT